MFDPSAVAPTVYLDHAASTPMHADALAAMVEQLGSHGNPSGAHRVARAARHHLEDARDQVASILGMSPHGIIFTSGGTEADNLAISGVVAASGGRPVCGATEHHAVLDPVRHHGGDVVNVTSGGAIDLDHLDSLLDDEVSVVSVMAVNNETGVMADLDAISALVRAKSPQAVLHCDAVQAANWVDLASIAATVDAVSLAGHKFGGPKGAGVLAVREQVVLEPLVRGGGQEHERRSGTQNVAAAVGFAVALAAATSARAEQAPRISALSDRILDAASALAGVRPTVDVATRVPGICHLTTDVESEALLVLLEQHGVMASAASSCASGALQPSHVLMAMGRSLAEASGALRLSMAHASTDADVDHLIGVLGDCLGRLRAGSRADRVMS